MAGEWFLTGLGTQCAGVGDLYRIESDGLHFRQEP